MRHVTLVRSVAAKGEVYRGQFDVRSFIISIQWLSMHASERLLSLFVQVEPQKLDCLVGRPKVGQIGTGVETVFATITLALGDNDRNCRNNDLANDLARRLFKGEPPEIMP
ncbi:hypothetical protein J6590_036177 [Homalodisca vitripennis]|nr:hypothetical protein J6590_036177 [Homalodisca vitripennis]